MKNYRLILVLISVLAIVGGLVYWDEAQTEKETEQAKLKNKIFTDLAIKDISDFSLENKEFDYRIQLKKTDGQWLFVKPEFGVADQSFVDNFLRPIVDLKAEKILTEDVRADAVYGLDEAQIRLVLNDGELGTIALGTKTPVGFSRYAKVDGVDGLVLFPGHVYTSLNKKTSDFRHKTIRLPEEISLDVLTLVNEEELVFENDNGNWKMVSDRSEALDQSIFKEFVKNLSGNIIEDFIDEPSQELLKALSSENSESETIATLRWLQKESSNSVEWQFIRNNDNLYAKVGKEPVGFKIKNSILDELSKTAWDFVDKRFFKKPLSEINKISIDSKEFELNEEGEWRESNNQDIKADFIRSLLIDIEYARTLGNQKKSLLSDISLSHQITLNSTDTEINISLYKNPEDNETVLFQIMPEDTLYTIDDDILENLSDRTLAKSTDEEDQG
ncbi:MAG: DUF4340 domain-containing protein [Pseudobacteriovorax sp.]|nr:DUF4340 domain-containing protein [Pseudobacteriovorax sp.]